MTNRGHHTRTIRTAASPVGLWGWHAGWSVANPDEQRKILDFQIETGAGGCFLRHPLCMSTHFISIEFSICYHLTIPLSHYLFISPHRPIICLPLALPLSSAFPISLSLSVLSPNPPYYLYIRNTRRKILYFQNILGEGTLPYTAIYGPILGWGDAFHLLPITTYAYVFQ
jgi:hypothetical protein